MWLCRTIARSPAAPSGDMTDGEEIECPVEVARPQAEVGARNRGREAVVEGLGQAQRLVDAVPTDFQGDLMHTQLASVEEAQHLDAREVRLAELAELLGAVLVDVPRVVRLLGALRGEREQIGCRDEG